jgi:hypothetical protein
VGRLRALPNELRSVHDLHHGYVVFLVVLAGGAEPATAKYRIINTLIGGSLALIFAAAWPAPEELGVSRVNDEGPTA